MMNKRRIFGLPVLAMVIGMLLSVSVALGAWFMNREVPTSVTVLGSDAEVFLDAGLTIPADAVNFGAVWREASSSPVSLFIANTGDEEVYAAISHENLPSGITMTSDGDAVPASPSHLILGDTVVINTTTLSSGIDAFATIIEVVDHTAFPASGTLFIESEELTYSGKQDFQAEGAGSWAATGTATLNAAITAVDTPFYLAGDYSLYPASGVLLIDDELISYTGIGSGQITGTTRGYDGTTPADHAIGTLAQVATFTPGAPALQIAFIGVVRGTNSTTAASHSAGTSINDLNGSIIPIAEGGVMEIQVVVDIGIGAARDVQSFSIWIEAQKAPF